MVIQDNTEEVLEAIAKAKKAALEAIGMAAETYAKENTPVDTGRLRNSITYATSDFLGIGTYTDNLENEYSDATAHGTPKENEVYIGTNVEYAPSVELGGQNRTAHHMLQRAANEHKDEYRQLVEDAFKSL